MEKWVLAAKRADFQEIGRKYGIDPVIARIIRNRDITEDAEINQYLNGTLDDIPSWKSLKDIDKAVEIISQKIDLGTRMRIIGDYDIDGVTATYILLKGFKRLGANVDTYIPDRIADGYGIHNHLIEKAKEDGVDTIVTCDNGISAADQIAFAKKMGMRSLLKIQKKGENTSFLWQMQLSIQNSLTVYIQIKISVAQWLQ